MVTVVVAGRTHVVVRIKKESVGVVVSPRIGGLGGDLAPGEVVAVVPRVVCADIASRPECARWKIKVNVFVLRLGIY